MIGVRSTTFKEMAEEYRDLPEFLGINAIGVDTVGNFGNTPLHVAACRGKEGEVGLLIAEGAFVNAWGEFGNTPLHEAVGQSMYDAAELLLRAGANPHLRNDFGESPMDLALKPGRETFKALLERYDLKR